MILVLGGFVFAGRHVLARHLTALMNAHRYPVNEKKQRLHRISPDGSLVERTVEPKKDADLHRLYQKILEELPLLVKMHDVIIIDDAFHREAPRETFIQAARKLDDVAFVWIDAPDVTVSRRVPYLRSLHVVMDEDDAHTRFKLRKAQMQFSAPPLIFFHEVSSRAAARRLKAFIELAIDRGFTQNTKRH